MNGKQATALDATPSETTDPRLRRLDPERLGEYIDPLMRIARSLCRTREEADELVQETMLQVLKRPRHIRHETDLPYLATVMRHAFYARKHLPPVDVSIEDLPRDALGSSRSDTEASVHVRMVLKAIGEMPDRHREVLVAVDVAGYSYRDAAAMLDVPEGTIMSRLHRARRRITEDLDFESGEPAFVA